MLRVFVSTLSTAVFLAMVAPSFAGAETLKGQIVDQACYLKNKTDNAGKDHKMPADTK